MQIPARAPAGTETEMQLQDLKRGQRVQVITGNQYGEVTKVGHKRVTVLADSGRKLWLLPEMVMRVVADQLNRTVPAPATANQRRTSGEPLPPRTVIERYKDYSRKIFHRTPELVFTHDDTDDARSLCEVCPDHDENEPEQVATAGATADGSRTRVHKLDGAAAALFAATADPHEFDELRRQGWPGWAASGSQLLPPCGPECHICFSTAEDNIAAHRRARRKKK
jgi:preprotein translocase subunit YajC